MIISTNLNTVPFLSSTDSTRAGMSAKQISQALTSKNTEIPYVIGSDYRYVRDMSNMGIVLAKDDGKVLYKNNDIMIVQYINLNTVEDIHIPPAKKVYSIFGTTLRSSMNILQEFKKGDILASYDCFLDGIPTYGYNVFAMYAPFFGYNHEDSLVISESLANKAKIELIDKVYIPIYEYSWMHPYYKDDPNSYQFFPGVGQKIKDDVICCLKVPKESSSSNHADLKSKVQSAMKNMSLSGLLTIDSLDSSKFVIDKIKTKLSHGTVTGIKIHRLKDPNLIDMVSKDLQKTLEGLYKIYTSFIVNTYHDLSKYLHIDYVRRLLKKYYVFGENKGTKGDINLQDICYLIEIEVTKEEKTVVGDKLANRFANKGVISLILPDELRPIAVESQKPIDLIFNPFSVFSRMNLGQVLESMVGKSVMRCSEQIKNYPETTEETLTWLNESILKHIDPIYYENVKINIINKLNNKSFRDEFIKSVKRTNLFVEAPSFAEVDISKILANCIQNKESILLKKELISFMKNKLKVKTELPDQEIILKDIFCAPIYIQKLFKLASKSVNARDLGPVKAVTKQPLKGKAKGGGSRIG